MDFMPQQIFHREVERQCKFALMAYEVEENSLLKPRTFRSHFEHLDTPLEEWAVSSKLRVFIDANIGPMSRINGAKPGDDFRNVDPINFAATLPGDSYYLRPIVEAQIHGATYVMTDEGTADVKVGGAADLKVGGWRVLK